MPSDSASNKSQSKFELQKILSNELAKVLNEVHGTSFSLRFWNLMLTKHVNASISLKPYLEKTNFYRKPNFQSINSWSPPSFNKIFKTELIRIVKYFILRVNKNKFFYILQDNDNILLGFPEIIDLQNDRLGAKLPSYDLLYLGRGDSFKRKHVNKIALKYDDTYIANVIRQLPTILVEHFKSTYDSIDLYSPENKTIHLHMERSLYDRFMVAKYVEHKATLYWYQHGSSLGEVEGFSGHLIPHDLADEFRTWGWKMKEKDVPWKAYRLEEFRKTYCKYNNTNEVDLLMCFPNISNENRDTYSGSTKQFLTNLREEKYKRIVGRPRRTNKIHSHKSQLNFIQDSRVYVSSGLMPMPKAMSKARLVLQMMVPSTNFLECIYVNHPVVGLLRNKQPTSIVEPYYQFFLKEKVLHKDLKSLYEFLNTVDIEYWWNDLIENPMYQSFKNSFTRKV